MFQKTAKTFSVILLTCYVLDVNADNYRRAKESPAGPSCPPCTPGPPGPPGPPGALGPKGADGAVGPKGEDGTNGSDGINGTNGSDGAMGPKGDDGAPGPKGDEGTSGSDGINGTDGSDGAMGPKGDDGAPGPKGDEGTNGSDGINGTNGSDGAMGPKGDDGPPGPKGDDGTSGSDGINGTNGSDGAMGPPGEPGTPRNVSTVYVRWGRTTCNDTTAELVNAGLMGGNANSFSGGGANYICLVNDPIYDQFVAGHQVDRSYLYHTEYESVTGPVNTDLAQHNAPCAVCEAPRVALLTVHGTNQCPPGWTLEYSGYLMTEGFDQNQKKYVCVDRDFEGIPGTQGNDFAAGLYFVESQCFGLSCPNYVVGNEVTCAVCTK